MTVMWPNMKILKIQDGGRLPYWKSFLADCPIPVKFCVGSSCSQNVGTGQIPTFHRTYSGFPNAVWACASGGISYRLWYTCYFHSNWLGWRAPVLIYPRTPHWFVTPLTDTKHRVASLRQQSYLLTVAFESLSPNVEKQNFMLTDFGHTQVYNRGVQNCRSTPSDLFMSWNKCLETTASQHISHMVGYVHQPWRLWLIFAVLDMSVTSRTFTT